jgi:hypothetical protein
MVAFAVQLRPAYSFAKLSLRNELSSPAISRSRTTLQRSGFRPYLVVHEEKMGTVRSDATSEESTTSCKPQNPK